MISRVIISSAFFFVLVFGQESKWHLLIGGLNSLQSVELYNWETQKHCQLGSLPVFSESSVGILIDGVTMVCGVDRDFLGTYQSCYKFNPTTKGWTPGPTPFADVRSGDSVMIPYKGWFIFGGNNQLQSAQKLTSIYGEWETGPYLYEQKNVSQQCIVQLSDTLTAFIGGTYDPQGIVTLDWTTMQYRKVPTKLRYRRLDSGCAVVVDATGTRVVAIVGGFHDSSMEIWSPRDDTITLVSAQVPPGQGSAIGLVRPEVFPIFDGKAIVLYAGFPEVQNAVGQVWQYFFDPLNSWVKLEDLSDGKFKHVAIPMFGLTC